MKYLCPRDFRRGEMEENMNKILYGIIGAILGFVTAAVILLDTPEGFTEDWMSNPENIRIIILGVVVGIIIGGIKDYNEKKKEIEKKNREEENERRRITSNLLRTCKSEVDIEKGTKNYSLTKDEIKRENELESMVFECKNDIDKIILGYCECKEMLKDIEEEVLD